MNLTSAEYFADLLADKPANYPTPAVFFETGTFQGRTATVAARIFSDVHTIEISEELYAAARAKITHPNVTCYLGDSAELIQRAAADLDRPVVWYLDAHWFHRPPEQLQIPDLSPFPLWAELEAIRPRPFTDCVIIDDASVFGKGPEDWPWPIGPQWREVSPDSIREALDPARIAADARRGDAFVVWRKPAP